MSTITIGAELAALLGGLRERTAIRDADGKLIGIFTPETAPERQYQGSVWTQADLEEAERSLAKNEKGYTLEQVKEYLRSLEQQG